MSAADRRRFVKQIDKLVRQTGKLERDKVDEMLKLLKQARTDIQDEILRFRRKGFKFSANSAKQIKDEIERRMRDFEDAAKRLMRDAQQQMVDLAELSTEEVITVQGFKPPSLGLSPSVIENSMTRSADLIRTLSVRQVTDASNIVNRAMLTGKSPWQVAVEMRDRFGGTIGQMERIARTEMLGIHSQAQQAELEEMSRDVPGTMKQWIAVVDDRTRLGHKEAHLQSVPVDKPFIVRLTVVRKGVERLGRSEELMRPRDARGSAANVINCRCTMVADFTEITEDEPLTPIERPPVQAPLRGVGAQVAKSTKKGLRNLR